MRRRDEVDCLRALLNQTLKNLPQMCRRYCDAATADRDVRVLAEGTAQGAAAEKDRACPAFSTDHRLFAVMEHRPRKGWFRRHSAKAALSVRSVDAALPRAEPAIFIGQHKIPPIFGFTNA